MPEVAPPAEGRIRRALVALAVAAALGACTARPAPTAATGSIPPGCSAWTAVQQVDAAPSFGLVRYLRCAHGWTRQALVGRDISAVSIGGGRTAVAAVGKLRDHVRVLRDRRLVPVPGLPDSQPSYMPSLDRGGRLALVTFDGQRFELLVSTPQDRAPAVRYRSTAELVTPQWLPSGEVALLLTSSSSRLAQLAVVDTRGRLRRIGLPQSAQTVTALTADRFALLDITGPVPRTTIVDGRGRPVAALVDVRVLGRDGEGFLATSSTGELCRYSTDGALLTRYPGRQQPPLIQLVPGAVQLRG